MNRVKLLISEAVHSIGANLSNTVAATLTVVIGMFLLGISIGLGSWIVSWSESKKDELRVSVYMCTGETCAANRSQAQIAGTNTFLQQLQQDGKIKEYRWISKEEAWKKAKGLQETFGEVIGNPLPDEFRVTPSSPEQVKDVATEIRAAKLAGIQQVRAGGEFSKRVLTVARLIEVAFALIVIILLAASAALIQNTIRLSIFSRRREIEVMKLVGASNWFVRGPFMIEGLIVGAGGTLVAVLLLLLGKLLVLERVFPEDTSDTHAWSFFVISTMMVGVGILLSAIGTSITLRRYLRV